jgi:hypothetical protein
MQFVWLAGIVAHAVPGRARAGQRMGRLLPLRLSRPFDLGLDAFQQRQLKVCFMVSIIALVSRWRFFDPFMGRLGAGHTDIEQGDVE